MRKTNSKALLQPSNGLSTTVAMSPNQNKQQSMIQMYKQKTLATSGSSKGLTSATSIISKVISAKRNLHPQSFKDNSSCRQHQNTSAQVLKPTSVLSPGDALNRKNETIYVTQNTLWEKIKAHEANKMVSPNQLQENENITNMKKPLQKHKSLQSFFNTTQNLSTKRNQPKPLKQENGQRQTIRRGSKQVPSSYNSGFQDKLSITNQAHTYKNDQTLTRIRSAFLNFNQTQPSLLINKTEIDLRDQTLLQNKIKNKIIQQSPSVSSEDEIEQEAIKKVHHRIATAYQGNLATRNSKKPNGSFIESKMKNCLQSRNNESLTMTYQTYQGGEEVKDKQIGTLFKIMSQPQLHKTINMTQRNFVKNSFLNRKESTQHTPMEIKSPKIKQSEQSTSSKANQIQILKGDMKSLNLSPIVPQNLVKNQYASINSQEKTVDTTTRKLEMRKDSMSSKNNLSTNNNKSFLSLKKEGDFSKLNNISKEPSTEKKMKAGFLNFNVKKQIKQGYQSQETERGPGAINSYSTTDEIQAIPTFEFNNTQDKTTLRIQHKNGSTQNIKKVNLQPSNSQANIFSNQNMIKVTQILNNNNMNKNKRYNYDTCDSNFNDNSVIQEKNYLLHTPKAVPEIASFVETVQNTANIKIVLADDDLTLKKHQNDSDSSSDEEDDEMPDARDFEEFYQEEDQNLSKQSSTVLPLLQDKSNNLLKNYNDASTYLHHRQKHPYEDRSSLVNYDTSLLTHNTGRDNQQSPFSYMRPSQPDDKQIKIFPDSFVDQHNTLKKNTSDVYGMLCDTQEQDEEPILVEVVGKQRNDQYKDFLCQIQKEEEQVIENVTQKIIGSDIYKELRDDKARAKYLSGQILEVRKHYKQVFIENIFKQAKIQ